MQQENKAGTSWDMVARPWTDGREIQVVPPLKMEAKDAGATDLVLMRTLAASSSVFAHVGGLDKGMPSRREALYHLFSLRFMKKSCSIVYTIISIVEKSALLFITVEDVNENPPKFTQPVYYANVSELQTVDNVVFTFKGEANDTDKTGEIKEYNITNWKDYFRTGGVAADGNIVLIKKLDYDNDIRTFNLIVWALDNGTPTLSASTTLVVNVIDEDDLNPVFEKDFYELSALENTTLDSLFVHPPIHAYDADLGINQTVMYEISSVYPPKYESYFQVNNESGVLQVVQKLDREQIDAVTIQLKQLDNIRDNVSFYV
ncbi:cadherin-related family member 2-like [Lingula anatina]|uniref:Cadherin-related family member 2-like n=1 Tax=Lingula anatina TaxID=7574 RepID=A0A1S3ITK0_LINAN|nr:cadherin-related family member 2-like [Lingula anatina]|eukprot:XP_013401527.1 cadherin-related family member 2-like [Lingula anatina]